MPAVARLVNPHAYYGDTRYRKRHVHTKFHPETIATALRRARGGIAAAARALRCSRATVQRYMMLYPDLRQLADDEIGLVLDLCEETLFHDAICGDPDARKFVLLTRGRDRGYIIRREVTCAHGTPLQGGESHRTLILIGGDKQQYLQGLRRVRELARSKMQSPPPDAGAVAGPGDGRDDAGTAPG